jgi:hypothetical protein
MFVVVCMHRHDSFFKQNFLGESMRKSLLLLMSVLLLVASSRAQDVPRRDDIIPNTKRIGRPLANSSLEVSTNVSETPLYTFSITYDANGNPLSTFTTNGDVIVGTDTTTDGRTAAIYFRSPATGLVRVLSNASFAVSGDFAQNYQWFLAYPSIGTTADGRIIIAFSAYSTVASDTDRFGYRFSKGLYVQSTNNGASWSPAVVVAAQSGVNMAYLTVAPFNETGNANFVYAERRNTAANFVQRNAASGAAGAIPTYTSIADTTFLTFAKFNLTNNTLVRRTRTGVNTRDYDYMTNGGEIRTVYVEPASNGQNVHATFVTSFNEAGNTWPDRNTGYAYSANGGQTWVSSQAISSSRKGFTYIAGVVSGLPVILHHGPVGAAPTRATVAVGDGGGATTFSEFSSPQLGTADLIWPKGVVTPNGQRIAIVAAQSGGTELVGYTTFDIATQTFAPWTDITTSNPRGAAEGGGGMAIGVTRQGVAAGRIGYLITENNTSVLKNWIDQRQSTDNGTTFGAYSEIGVARITKIPVSSVKQTGVKAEAFSLSQNYPNPFNPSTTITYTIPTSGDVSLRVYDMLGREVSTLVNGRQAQGSYNVSFNASTLASGVYFYKLQSGSFTETKKMMLVK